MFQKTIVTLGMSTYQRARKLQPFKINKEKTYLRTVRIM